MNCPNCGSKNHSESEVCTQSGTLGAGLLADKAAENRALLEQYSSGRRNTMVGVLLLCGAFLILLALILKGLPPFIAFLWTCWVFMWGVITLAEGSARWLFSHRQIKALASAIPRYRGGSRTETDSDGAGGQPERATSKIPSAQGERPIERPIGTLLDKASSG
jgi:hypothetical protein